MSFKYYHQYYGYIVGTQIRGQIGKKQVYRIRNGRQQKYSYYVPFNPQTPAQQANRLKYAHSIKYWQALSPAEKALYNSLEKVHPHMSGFNYYIHLYMKDKIQV